MQGPTGVAGVHFLPNSGQAGGGNAPLEHVAAAAAGQGRHLGQAQVQAGHGVEIRVFGPQGQAALRDAAQAAPERVGGLEKLLQQGARLGIARVVHSAGIGVDHGRGLVPQLFGHEAEGQEVSAGSKPPTTPGIWYSEARKP